MTLYMELYKDKLTGNSYTLIGTAILFDERGMGTDLLVIFQPENEPNEMGAMRVTDFRKFYVRVKREEETDGNNQPAK